MIILGHTSKFPESRCIYCNARVDAAFGAGNDDDPSPGDTTLCSACGNWMIFGPNMEMQAPSKEELKAIDEDDNCRMARYMAMKVIRLRAKRN